MNQEATDYNNHNDTQMVALKQLRTMVSMINRSGGDIDNITIIYTDENWNILNGLPRVQDL